MYFFTGYSHLRDPTHAGKAKNTGVSEVFLRLKKFYELQLETTYPKGYADPNAISKDKDVLHIIRLLELILGAAVQSDKKETVVDTILKLDEIDQIQLMDLMEKVAADSEARAEPKDSIQEEVIPATELVELQGTLAAATAQNKLLEVKIQELEEDLKCSNCKVQELDDTNQALKKENQELRAEIIQLSHQKDMEQSKAFEELSQKTVELEAQLADKESLVENLNKTIVDLSKDHKEQLEKLKDELYISKEKLRSYADRDDLIEKYKKRLESMETLSDQNKQLEGVIERYGKMLENYEKELRAQKDLQGALAICKTQVNELKDACANYEMTVKDLNRQIEGYKRELAVLRGRNKAVNSEEEFMRQKKESESELNLQQEKFVKEFSDKLYQLERESELLKLQKENATKKEIMELQDKIAELKRENLSLKHDIGYLQKNLEEMEQNFHDVETLKKKEKELIEKVVQLEKNLNEKDNDLELEKGRNERLQTHLSLLEEASKATKAQIETLLKEKGRENEFSMKLSTLEKEKAILALRSEISQMNLRMKEREEELQVEHNKYQADYLKKIEEMRNVYQKGKEEFQSLIKSKNNEIQMYRQLCEKGSEELLRENRLIFSAFYELGLELCYYKKHSL